MRLMFIFVFVLVTALQNSIFGQVDTISVDTFSIDSTTIDSLPEIDPYPFLPDSLQAEYKTISESIFLDSSEWNNFIDRGNLISGINEFNQYQSIYGNEKVFEDAFDDYSEAIELRPYSHKGYLNRGILNHRFLKLEEAIEDYDKALENAWDMETKIKIRSLRAMIKAQLGQHDIAIKDLEKVLERDNQNPVLLNTLALIHCDLEEYSKALRYLNRSLEYHPKDSPTLANLGFVALEAGKFQKAINILDEQIENDSTSGVMHSNRGFAKFKLGKKQEGLEDLNKAIELNSVNSFAYKYRAIVNFDLGKNDEACQDLLEAKRLGYSIEYGDEVIILLFENCLDVNRKPSKQ